MKKTTILLIMLLLSSMTFAQVSTWDGTWEPWTHGTGTEADPFLIENARQLAYLAYRVNNGLDAGGGHVSNHDYHYKLMVDVDLNGSESFQWTPIGYWNSDADYQAFGGCFDGSEHTISNLYINSTADRVGFFGYAVETTIENLKVNGGTIATTGQYAGGIVGCAGTATIINCHNIGSVSTTGHTYFKGCGGIVGAVDNAATITNCHNTGSISALDSNFPYSGGIVGRAAGTVTTINCYNTGRVSASGNYPYSGGIVGFAISANISNSYNEGTTSASYYNGGLVGWKEGGTITNCFYLNTCGGNNTYGGEPQTDVFMQSLEFVSILNAGSLTFKKDVRPFINQGYPVFSGFNIETRPASSAELTSAVLNGSYTSGVFSITSQGFEYKKTTDQNYTTVNCMPGQTPFFYELSDLESGATYQYRAFVVANEGRAYGELVEFTTTTVNTHQILAYVSGPGIITPNGGINVIEGEDLTIEIASIAESVLDSVEVDYVNVGPVTSYTFNNVTEHHVICAYFSLVSPSDLNPWNGVTINEPFYYDNTYYIISPTELAWVARETNLGNSFQGMTIIIMNELDLGGAQAVPSEWTPIGTEINPFQGSCRGYSFLNKTIKNLYCNSAGNNNVGLFGCLEGSATIGHIQLRNVNVVGNANVGGLVGLLKEKTIGYCSVTGQIRGKSNVGGLIGCLDELDNIGFYGSMMDCFAVANVEANENAGGLIGKLKKYNNNTSRKKIAACFSSGIVQSQGVSGGLVGCIDLGYDYQNAGELIIEGCYSNATVLGLKCGGMVGSRTNYENTYYGSLNFSNCYVSGVVSGGYGFISKDNGVSELVANCANCFYDEQSTGCGNNNIIGVSPKKTHEMTTNYGFGFEGWYKYVGGLYPQLLSFEGEIGTDNITLLSVSPVFLQNNENSSSVQSNFQVSTANGVTWSSSNPDVIAINGSNAIVNPTINETVTLTATLNGISKQVNVTVANPNTILVYEPSDLRYIAEQCNAGETFEGKCVKLMNDIVLPENVPNNMISIGSYPNRPFKGTFDGNGKLITNLYIDQPNTPYQGFFGYTLNANLYNVGLVNITASGRNYTGGMVAYAKNTYMRDCYVNGGTLFALSYCGGLVGYQEQGTNSIISGCYNTCEVTGNNYVGGLIGFSNYSTVRNSYVAGRVSAQGEPVGAIIGGANEVLMYYCYFSTELTGQTNAIGWNNIGKAGGEGMTNAQMRDPQFVNTLNQNLVTPVWMADYANHINNGFPIIKWQRPGTGVEENVSVKKSISLFPNPAKGFVTIQSDEPSVTLKHMEIYDVMGRMVLSETLDGQCQELSISKLVSGFYHVRVQTNNGHCSNLKLVVQ